MKDKHFVMFLLLSVLTVVVWFAWCKGELFVHLIRLIMPFVLVAYSFWLRKKKLRTAKLNCVQGTVLLLPAIVLRFIGASVQNMPNYSDGFDVSAPVNYVSSSMSYLIVQNRFIPDIRFATFRASHQVIDIFAALFYLAALLLFLIGCRTLIKNIRSMRKENAE